MSSEAWMGLRQRIVETSSGDTRPVHEVVIEPGYIIPRTESPNWSIAASILERWINDANKANPGSMTSRSAEWLTTQAKEGNLVMIVGYPTGQSHQSLFGKEQVDPSVIEDRIIAIACVNEVGGFSREELLDIGTVVTNPQYRSTDDKKGIDGGAYAFLAALHKANQMYPDARKNSWTKNGSEVAIRRAAGRELPVLQTSVDEVDRGMVEVCRNGCVKFNHETQMCCHSRHELTEVSTSGMFQAAD